MGRARAGRLEGRGPQVGSSTNFYVFLRKIFEFHKYRSRAWTVFCVHTEIEKQIEHSTGGLNTHTSPLHQRGFPCLDNMGSAEQLR